MVRRKVRNRARGGSPLKTWQSILLLLVGLLIVGGWGGKQFVDVYRSINSISVENPLDYPLYDSSDGDSVKTTLVVVDGGDKGSQEVLHAYVVIWNTDLETGVVITLPGWLYITPSLDLPESSVAVRDLLYASEAATGKGTGLVHEVSNTVGIRIDEYVYIDAYARESLGGIFGSVGDSTDPVVFFDEFIGSMSTMDMLFNNPNPDELAVGVGANIPMAEVYDNFSRLKSLLGSKYLPYIDLGEEWASREGALSSGTEVMLLNYVEFDDRLSEYIRVVRSRDVEKEQAKVEVFNSGPVPGLAGRMGRKIQNSGVEVVRSGNSPRDVQDNLLYVADMEGYVNSLKVVESVVYDTIGEYSVIEGRPDFLTTGDIIVIIGR